AVVSSGAAHVAVALRGRAAVGPAERPNRGFVGEAAVAAAVRRAIDAVHRGARLALVALPTLNALRTLRPGGARPALRPGKGLRSGVPRFALRARGSGRSGFALRARGPGRSGFALRALRTGRAGLAFRTARAGRTLRSLRPCCAHRPLRALRSLRSRRRLAAA